MGKRKSNAEKTRTDMYVLGIVGVVAVVVLCSYGAWLSAGLAAIGLYLVWEGCARPTVCDVQNKSGRGPCGNDAFGRLRACTRQEHRRVKQRALRGWVRRPARGGLDEPVWHRDGRVVPSGPDGGDYVPAPEKVRLLLAGIALAWGGALLANIVQFVIF
jgi:hypothetical protein